MRITVVVLILARASSFLQHGSPLARFKRTLSKVDANPTFLDELFSTVLDPLTNQHYARQALGSSEEHHCANNVKPVKMQSNDYLSLASDSRIAMAKSQALQKYGHGDAISRVFTHNRSDPARAFEQRIAALCKAEDAFVTSSGYTANSGLLESIAKQGTNVYIDHFAHASLWQGIRRGAKARRFRHNDTTDLERLLKNHGPGIVVVDSLYSTTGRACPLEDVVQVVEEYGCAIVVDETHSFGCHGPDGAGLCVALGVQDRVHFRTAGLSKAMAARGGVVIGSQRCVEYARYESPPMIFSTSVLGYEIAGFEKALDIIRDEPWRTEKLHANHAHFKEGLVDLGFKEAMDSDHQILSILTGSFETTVAMRQYLFNNGVLGSVFIPPATPEDGCLIRFTMNCDLRLEEIDRALGIIASSPIMAKLSRTSKGPAIFV